MNLPHIQNFIMSAPTESSPLITKHPKRKCWKCCLSRVRYRLPKIKEKGAIVAILCNVLILSAIFAPIRGNHLISSTFSIAVALISITVFPIAGIVADTCVGRFKVIQASVAILMGSSLLSTILTLLPGDITSKSVPTFVLLGLHCIGGSCYVACCLPFIGDQLIGASGEQLSFALYWMMWGFVIAYNTILLSYLHFDYANMVAPAAALLCVSTMAFILWRCKHALNTVHQLTNPYKRIFRVLHYSWKHKYPERRSAFTYWEEDIPSRIDLGMSKYGGPFTVEEVEDVKTVFRLFPVIFSTGGFCVGMYVYWETLLINEYPLKKTTPFLAYSHMFNLMVVVLGIPLYHFLIYPFFYNYIPTMLRRIGFGLLLLFSSFIMYAIVGNILLCSSRTNVTCLFLHSEIFNISTDGLWWLLFPSTAYHLGFSLSALTLAEFVFAQTPHSIRGLMSGLSVLSASISSCIGFGVCRLASSFFSKEHSWFISNISLTIVSAVYLILFVCFSKCYKLPEEG